MESLFSIILQFSLERPLQKRLEQVLGLALGLVLLCPQMLIATHHLRKALLSF